MTENQKQEENNFQEEFEKEIWGKGHFPNKVSPNEKIVLITRQDSALITLKVLGLIFLFVAIFIFRTVAISMIEVGFWVNLIDVLMYSTNGVLLLMFTILFHNYYLSMQIVTNQRIIDIDQLGLFNRQVNELAIENVQDVTYTQNGILGLIFGFGDVIIKTSSNMNDVISKEEPTNGFVFESVPEPRKVVEEVNKVYHGYKEQEKEETAKLGAEAIKGVFGEETKTI